METAKQETTKRIVPENWNPGFTPIVPLREFFLIIAKDKRMCINGEIKRIGDYSGPALAELKARWAGKKVYDI